MPGKSYRKKVKFSSESPAEQNSPQEIAYLIREKALELLARREHSQGELRNKLHTRGFNATEIDPTLTELAAQGLQSDERFIEAFIASRMARGHGPIKIIAELRARGIAGDQITPLIEINGQQWQEIACTARHRRFGNKLPLNPQERATQMRFLARRGFTNAQICAALLME